MQRWLRTSGELVSAKRIEFIGRRDDCLSRREIRAHEPGAYNLRTAHEIVNVGAYVGLGAGSRLAAEGSGTRGQAALQDRLLATQNGVLELEFLERSPRASNIARASGMMPVSHEACDPREPRSPVDAAACESVTSPS